ncbi:MAG: hypothetical protein KF721_13950, partial [Ignavibacteriaceae bacterium]|nr:hypothetical protein [Ignavibacteriaceae bacterium]
GDSTELINFFKLSFSARPKYFEYYSKDFSMSIDPIIGIGYDFSKKGYRQYGGGEIYGHVGENWNYYLNFRDNTETGDKIDRRKLFTNESGISVLRSKSDLIDYSETRGGISYAWSTGNIFAGKEFLHIGSSLESSVILSEKAPSFPMIRFEFFPVDWFRYNVIHGWLDSDLIDSSTIRNTGVSSTVLKRGQTYSRLKKFYVGHTFSFQPFNNFWITLGESIIYGDDLEYIYFLPLFYRLADHYNSIGGDSGDNAQIFMNASYFYKLINSKLYLSLFIDELSPSDLFSGGDNAQVYALTLGTRVHDPLWKNSIFTIEFNAIRPYSYMNADQLHSYASSSYSLGHWIGSNAVQYYFGLEQYFDSNFELKTFLNYVIKGSKENLNSYYNKDRSTYPLLSGSKSDWGESGISIIYTPFNSVSVELNATYVSKATGRFENEYKLTKGFTIGTFFRYGI